MKSNILKGSVAILSLLTPIISNALTIDIESPNKMYNVDGVHKTALMIIAEDEVSTKNIELAKKILEDKGVNPFIVDSNGLSAMDYAKRNKNNVIGELIRLSYDESDNFESPYSSFFDDVIESDDYDSESPITLLNLILKSGSSQPALKLIDKHSINLNSFDESGLTPLMAATIGFSGHSVSSNHQEELGLMDELISRGADVDGTTIKSGLTTPLHLACVNDNYKLAAYFIKNGANPLFRNIDGDDSLAISIDNDAKLCSYFLYTITNKVLVE